MDKEERNRRKTGIFLKEREKFGAQDTRKGLQVKLSPPNKPVLSLFTKTVQLRKPQLGALCPMLLV